MIYGYARISTSKQSIERQVKNLKEYNPDINIIKEIYTGTKTEERKAYQSLKRRLKSGDTLVFDSVSRMSRNAEEGIKEYFKLLNKGVKLVFLKEKYINTDIYLASIENTNKIQVDIQDLNKTLLEGIREYLKILARQQIRIAFDQSEKEVEDLRQRTKEALKVRKDNGVILGRKVGTKLNTQKSLKAKEGIMQLSKDFNGNLKDIEVMKYLDISRNSFYKYKRELKGE